MKLSEIIDLPGDLKVGGSLYLRGTQITSLPEGLSVGGYLDLRGTQITSLPEGLSVGGSLYLEGTQITSLPEGLSVGGSLYLEGTQITSLVTEAGDQNRTIGIWDDANRGLTVSLGCWSGSPEEAKNAIANKYSGQSMIDYQDKIDEAVKRFNESKKQITAP